MSVLVSVIDSVHPALSERLRAAGHRVLGSPQQKGVDKDTEVLIVRSSRVDAEMIAQLPLLRYIGRVGSGLENIDLDRCVTRGIRVINSPEGNRDGVGEMAVLLLLALLKKLASANLRVKQGQWPREEFRGLELKHRTVGIIGYGQMGSAFAERLHGFGTRILAHDRYHDVVPSYVEAVDLETLQRECDVLSLHVPLLNETRHYVDHEFIQSMSRPFWLINTARGAVVDSQALLAGLEGGQVLGAGLDVLEYEDPQLRGIGDDGSGTLRKLLAHEQVIFTPHVAGVTFEGQRKMADVLLDKLLNELDHDVL